MDGIRALCDVARMKALLIVAMLPFLQSCDSPASSSGATDTIASVETVDVDARDVVPDVFPRGLSDGFVNRVADGHRWSGAGESRG